MRINYDLAELRAFLEVARRGSFQAAAQRLNLSSSAVSRRVSGLEDALRTQLLTRTTRSVVLTEAGRNLYAFAIPLIGALDESVYETVQQGLGFGGTLSMSAISSVAFSIVPDVLVSFRESFPTVRLHLHDDTGRRVLESVLSRTATFGVNTITDFHPDVFVEKIIDDPYVLALPKSCLQDGVNTANWRHLNKFINTHVRLAGLGTSSANRQQIDIALQSYGIKVPWFDEVENLNAMLGLLRAGKTIAVMPRLALAACDEWGLTILPLNDPPIARQIGLIRRSDTPLSIPAEKMWSLLQTALLKFANEASFLCGAASAAR